MRNKVIHMTSALIDVSLHLENNIPIKLRDTTMVTLVDNSVNGIRDAISTIIFIIYPHTDGYKEIGSAVSHLNYCY